MTSLLVIKVSFPLRADSANMYEMMFLFNAAFGVLYPWWSAQGGDGGQ